MERFVEYITNAILNYRNACKKDASTKVGIFKKGVVVNVVEGSEKKSHGDTWVKIKYNDEYYFVVKDFLLPVSNSNSDEIKEGDKVTITGKYASSCVARTAARSAKIDEEVYVVKVHSGENYPYQLGEKKGDVSPENTVGFAKETSIKKFD